MEYDARLSRKQLGYFYLRIPKRLNKYNGSSQANTVALNPRVRIFFIGYDQDGIII